MAWTKLLWRNRVTYLDANNLNRIEDGIEQAIKGSGTSTKTIEERVSSIENKDAVQDTQIESLEQTLTGYSNVNVDIYDLDEDGNEKVIHVTLLMKDQELS